MTAHARDVWAGWAGFFAGPVCWFAQQELALWLLPADCGKRWWISPSISALFAIIVAIAALLASRSARRLPAPAEGAGFAARRTRFIALLGTISPLFFLAAIAWQGIAGLVYSGCER